MEKTHNKMTIAYNLQVSSVNRELKIVTKAIHSLVGVMSALPWLIALLLLIIFGLLYTALVYFPALSMRRNVAKLAAMMAANGVDELDQREVMIKHAEIEQIRLQMEELIEKGGTFYVIRPIIQEMSRTVEQFKIIEPILFKKAYPDYEKPLTTGEEKHLKSLYKTWEEDWRDEKMNVYND